MIRLEPTKVANNTIKPHKDVILIGFDYDKETKIVYEWIADPNFLNSLPNVEITRFHNGNAQEQKLLGNQLKANKSNSIEIFCGHGSDDALLGPPLSGASVPSKFYSIDMITNFPSSLFAFCCHSGKFFGLFYSVSGEEKKFMGFTNRIQVLPFLRDELKEIFQTVAISIVSDGGINEKHEKQFKDLITQLMENIEKGLFYCSTPLLALISLHNYKHAMERLN